MLRRILLAFFLVSMLGSLQSQAVAAAEGRFFPETGFYASGRFLEYWQQNGGISQFGLPISEPFTERNPDTGNEHLVQYFERNRFEYHPANDRGNDVQLGRLGAQSLALRGIDWRTGAQVANPVVGCQFFVETRHNICEPFLSYWKQHGGISIFGLPLSEARSETSPTDSQVYLTQHFERNRFEAHPELAASNNVLLGLLGRELYRQPAVDPLVLEVIDLLNAERSNVGANPVRLSHTLSAAAQSYSTVQAQQGLLNHTAPDGSNAGQRLSRAGYSWQRYGENLAAGQRSAREVIQAWMNSSGHRRNMLNPEFRDVGIGHTAHANDPANFIDYWVMELATPQ